MRIGALLLIFGAWTSAQAAHITNTKGAVSVTGAVDQTLAAGTVIQTGPNARADIQFESGDTFRMGEKAELRVTHVDPGGYRMELNRGAITYYVEQPDASQAEVLTPSVSVRAYEVGVYRIAVKQSGESEILAQSGAVAVFAPAGSQWLNAGQKMIARGSAANPEFRIVSGIPWWKRLAWLGGIFQIGGGGGSGEVSVAASGGGNDAKESQSTASHTKASSADSKPATGSAHASDDRSKTSDSHAPVSSGSAHSGSSRGK